MNGRDLVLHGAALKRHADADAIAALIGLPPAEVEPVLSAAVATGRAVEAKGGYALTPLGRLALEGRYGLHFAERRDDPDFVAKYEAFERINIRLKQAITDWQTVTVGGQRVANDHSDRAHDAAVIDRIGAIHEQVEPVLTALAGKLPRLKIHAAKLLRALEAAEDGDHGWISDIRRDSYHTVWFELHEDLLRIMGRERDE